MREHFSVRLVVSVENGSAGGQAARSLCFPLEAEIFDYKILSETIHSFSVRPDGSRPTAYPADSVMV